jgi:hypothetical protein
VRLGKKGFASRDGARNSAIAACRGITGSAEAAVVFQGTGCWDEQVLGFGEENLCKSLMRSMKGPE